jgi:hypothetical protein
VGKGIHERSDDELARSIASGELAPRKEAIAQEVLRRRSSDSLVAKLWIRMLGIIARIRRVFSPTS